MDRWDDDLRAVFMSVMITWMEWFGRGVVILFRKLIPCLAIAIALVPM